MRHDVIEDLVAATFRKKPIPSNGIPKVCRRGPQVVLNLDLPVVGLGRRGRHRRRRGQGTAEEDRRRGHGPKGRPYTPDHAPGRKGGAAANPRHCGASIWPTWTICARWSVSAAMASAIRCRNTRPRPSPCSRRCWQTAPGTTAQLMRVELVQEQPPELPQMPEMHAHHINPLTGRGRVGAAECPPADPRRRAIQTTLDLGQGRPQRSLSLRVRQEVQALPRRPERLDTKDSRHPKQSGWRFFYRSLPEIRFPPRKLAA
jgi:hypothetical protein